MKKSKSSNDLSKFHFNVVLPEEVRHKLRILSVVLNKSMSATVSDIILKYLDKEIAHHKDAIDKYLQSIKD